MGKRNTKQKLPNRKGLHLGLGLLAMVVVVMALRDSRVVQEIVIQVLCAGLAVLTLYAGVQDNKKYHPFTWKDIHSEKYSNVDAWFRGAAPIVIGSSIIAILLIKMFTCGLICWA